jgi:hypothetical protein
MPDPRELLVCLLDYIKEQTKEVDPKGYRLTSSKGFLRKRGDIAGLPGVAFDIRLAGDHVWLRVPRLAADPPPDPPPTHKGLLKISSDPTGVLPSLDDAALTRLVNRSVQALKAQGSPTVEDIARLADAELAEADLMGQQISASAPGSAPILEAEADIWVVRANAYTQSALAELMRTRGIDLANQSKAAKLATSDNSGNNGLINGVLTNR